MQRMYVENIHNRMNVGVRRLHAEKEVGLPGMQFRTNVSFWWINTLK